MRKLCFLLCLVLACTYSVGCIEDGDRISKIEAILKQQSILLQQQITKIKDLQTMVGTQQIEISQQQIEIGQLKMTIVNSRNNPKAVEENPENMEFYADKNSTQVGQGDMAEYSSSSKTDQKKKSKVSLSRDVRLLMGASTTPQPRTDAVAFYAYLSTNEVSPSTHHTIIFDVVKTDVHNCYNAFSGVFTPPVAGVYGLTYTLRMYCEKYASFEIIQNAEVQGEIHARAGNCGGQTTSGTIVVVAKKGDTIYVRTHPSLQASGDVLSDSIGRSFFAGWLISP